MRLLRSSDPTEITIMLAVTRRAFELREHFDRALAAEIINALARSMKGHRGATGAY